MNILYNLLRRKTFYFSMAILGFFVFAHQSLDMRLPDPVLKDRLEANPLGYQPQVKYEKFKDRTIRYLQIGKENLPLIVFIHGAPASTAFWQNMLRDSLLLSKARLMAIDRPGYGFSGYGRPEVSVKEQARMIAEVLRKYRDKHSSIILHGSSYGGTVTARIAMDYPDLVDGILLQSASVKPGSEKTYWISYPTHHWSLRWLMPGSIRVANAEKLSHQSQLEKMRNGWQRIKAAAIVLHGANDDLIYPDNGAYAFHRMVNAQYRDIKLLPGRKHDLLPTRPELLKRSLLKLLEVTSI